MTPIRTTHCPICTLPPSETGPNGELTTWIARRVLGSLADHIRIERGLEDLPHIHLYEGEFDRLTAHRVLGCFYGEGGRLLVLRPVGESDPWMIWAESDSEIQVPAATPSTEVAAIEGYVTDVVKQPIEQIRGKIKAFVLDGSDAVKLEKARRQYAKAYVQLHKEIENIESCDPAFLLRLSAYRIEQLILSNKPLMQGMCGTPELPYGFRSIGYRLETLRRAHSLNRLSNGARAENIKSLTYNRSILNGSPLLSSAINKYLESVSFRAFGAYITSIEKPSH